MIKKNTLFRLKNKLIAKLITRLPRLAKKLIASYSAFETEDIPWTPIVKPLSKCKIAIVTTCGLHHREEKPFNMSDKLGDPSYRTIDTQRPLSSLTITHDYYDHSDAEKDINIVFPIERLKELQKTGKIGEVSNTHYAFMGHIDGLYINILINETAKEVARKLKADNVDIALLTPA
ncbi:D-proline reductase [Candidatus Magnetoovum chiemensis]|nr:D-proline reductase [Candidatus Magnetoovum chiemensis]